MAENLDLAQKGSKRCGKSSMQLGQQTRVKWPTPLTCRAGARAAMSHG